ncbi:hypothetical protein G3I01_04280 [Gramella sp. MT6]|uniref:hypothetical protein n=1 Tax=Gramella sp. MT6 TaxID=2705471 RepID=UPI001C5D2130|nr:hypothetical protein [Gramella sp. MT6]QYA24754.1 hypothetical protein G3I01_04280 [Gramella sp. MT6]
MKTNYLGLALIAALGFTSCQSDVSSENPEEVLEIQNSEKEKPHDANKLHIPLIVGGDSEIDGYRLHDAGTFAGSLADCDTYVHYHGPEELTVFEDEPQSYHGEIELTSLALNDQLNICGTFKVEENIGINYAGVLNLGGDAWIGGDVTVIYGGHLTVQGKITIEGDLVLKKGATLEFLGEDDSIEVLGKVKIAKKAIINGDFTDVSNKIK